LRAGLWTTTPRRRRPIAITLDTNSHAIPAMQEDAAAKIAALLER
jgi:hypothetical protein